MALLSRKRPEQETDAFAEPENPFTRPGFLASGLVLVTVLGLGVYLALSGSPKGAGQSAGAAQAVPSASATLSNAVPAPAPSVLPDGSCPAFPAAPSGPVTTAGVTWTYLGQTALPYAKAAGPAVVRDGVARCYAQTSEGALLAICQIMYRSANTDAFRQVTEQQIVPGPGRDIFEQTVAASLASAATADPMGSLPGQYAGFSFLSYTGDSAVVRLVLRFPMGQLRAVVLTAQWLQGDWRLKLQDDGSMSTAADSPQTLDGFTPWSAT